MVITIAEDTAGAEAARRWIERAAPAHPSLIDERHLVSELYDMVNVPTAVWIDEDGRMVRTPEPAGAEDSFRQMDRATYAIPEAAAASLRESQGAYLEAIRDWVKIGARSRFVLSPEQEQSRLRPSADDAALAAAEFQMGEYLSSRGRHEAAQRHFAVARDLRPESWNYRRQSWALEDPMKAGGPEFWAAVDALGEHRYYPPIQLDAGPVT